MEAKLPEIIRLTESEQRLFDQIDFNKATTGFGAISRELMDSLIKRNAIPEIRLAYFTDPEFNLGRSRKSRLEIFKNRVGSVRKVKEHPHFIKYLKYFILGPDLSPQTMIEFCRIVNEAIDMEEELPRFVRKEVRNIERSKRTYLPEEFYKLALECLPYNGPTARNIREAARKVR